MNACPSWAACREAGHAENFAGDTTRKAFAMAQTRAVLNAWEELESNSLQRVALPYLKADGACEVMTAEQMTLTDQAARFNYSPPGLDLEAGSTPEQWRSSYAPEVTVQRDTGEAMIVSEREKLAAARQVESGADRCLP